MSQVIVVRAAFDPDAGVWGTESNDIHGLRIEAPTLDALFERIPAAVLDLLEEDQASGASEIPVEIIVRASARVRPTERSK